MDDYWKCPDCGSTNLWHLDTFEGCDEIVYKLECKCCGRRFYVDQKNNYKN